MAQATHADSHVRGAWMESNFAVELFLRWVGSFSFRGLGGSWLVVFNGRCGILLDPGMASMWRRGGERRHDSPDGRSLAAVVPCAGRGFRGRVLSLVSVYGPVG